MKMQKQLFIGDEAPSPEKLLPIKNRENWMKPLGGLWTSSWRGKRQNSAWVEWCISNEYRKPYTMQWYLLVPNNVSLYIIDSYEDLERCLQEFGIPLTYADIPFFREHRYLDFEGMSKFYTGLHLTAKGAMETHLSHSHDLNIWDVESTLWFRWCFSEIVRKR